MSRDLFGIISGGQNELGAGYTLAHHAERDTALSIAVSETGDIRNLIFIPRKCVTAIRDLGMTMQCQVGAKLFPAVEIDMPEWLAREKGMI